MTFWRKLMDHLGKTTTLVDAAKQMLEDAGFTNHDSFFARRVKDGVLNLAYQFQQENYSAVVGRLVAALFSRIARGSPPTPEFLGRVRLDIEAFAKDEPYDEQAEKNRWIHRRYPMLKWAGDLRDHVGGMVFPRPGAQRFAGAPLVRGDAEPAPELVDDKGPKPARRVRVSELRKMAKEGHTIAAIKLYRDATGKGLKESKDFVLALRDDKEPLELVDDRVPCLPVLLDYHGAALPTVPFAKSDNCGSERMLGKPMDLVPGAMSRTTGDRNVGVDPAAIDAAVDAAKKEIEGKMDAKSKTVEIVKELCRNMESFTSLDVSNRAKTEGLVARHREVAELVRSAFVDGVMEQYGYVRDMIDVTLPGGRTAQAYLYRHTTVPADDYSDRAQVAIRPQIQPAPQDDDDGLPALPTPIIPSNPANSQQPTAVATQVAPPVVGRLTRVLNTASVTRTQKGDGRLEVPHVWLARLGWQVGDTVSAVVDGNALVLKTAVQVGERVVRQFTVDRWSRIRITTRALSEIGLHFGTGGQHTMTLRTDGVRID
jgi:hypothetical protein